ncbi:MAG: acetyl-CoA carboxylase biotin carboxyl carrier protein [Pseudomonadota bacterium]
MGSKLDIDEKQIKRLADLLNESGLSELEVEEGGRRVKVARHATGAAVAAHPVAHPAVVASPPPAPELAAHPHASAAPVAGAVTSPMVGTIYVSPDPGAPPFVKVGDQVTEGQTLLIIEAMKVMNNLPSPRAGRVTEVLVRDGQPVEFGEALVVVQ